MARLSASHSVAFGVAILICVVGGCGEKPNPTADTSPTKQQGVKSQSTSQTTQKPDPIPQKPAQSESSAQTPQKPDSVSQKPTGLDQEAKPGVTKKEIGKNVYLEIDGDKRRVLINAVVVQRTVILEQLLCRAMTKEHEAILSADCDARMIHVALLAAGAEPGSPVKFRPKYTPANGDVIKVYLQYQEKGKTVKVPAQKWVREVRGQKELAHDWVFAGSALFPNQFEPQGPPIYAANDGDVICVANFDSALLDLPINSSDNNDDLTFEAFTERIPPIDTPVLVILEPVPTAKKK